MAELALALGAGLGAAVALQTIAWLVALRTKRVDIVDVFWGPTFVAIAFASIAVAGGTDALGWFVTALVVVWAARLSWHIYQRWRRARMQDVRYTTLMQDWRHEPTPGRMYVKIFVVQAVLATLVGLPIVVSIVGGSKALLGWPLVGFIVWLCGFVCESIADAQLKRFIAQGGEGVMKTGLWRYSRHPNYFGEIMQWWGIWCMTLATQWSLVALAGPVAITYLLRYISGVPLSEARAESRAGWAEYKQRTSVLIPWPPKK